MNKQKLSLNKKIVVMSIAFVMMFSVISAAPSGAEFSEIKSETAPADTPQDHEAIAGNVTEIDVNGFSTTRSWQGYFGNITGTIQLADSNDNQMYNWTLADPRGQIYASVGNSINWDNIHCFNFTADTGTTANDCETPGEYCRYGIDLETLETEYGIDASDVDGVNETFSEDITGETFYVGSLEFSSGECPRTNLFDSSGGATSNYEEVLLYDPVEGEGVGSRGYPIFTSLIEGGSVDGFDGRDHDFEMLVLEDGHGTDTATTTYYFYVELH